MRVRRFLMSAVVAVAVLGGTAALGTTTASAATASPACFNFCQPGW